MEVLDMKRNPGGVPIEREKWTSKYFHGKSVAEVRSVIKIFKQREQALLERATVRNAVEFVERYLGDTNGQTMDQISTAISGPRYVRSTGVRKLSKILFHPSRRDWWSDEN